MANKRPRGVRAASTRRLGLLAVGTDRSRVRAREDYVKAIYQLADAEPVKAAEVARYLGVSRVSMSKAKGLLERDGFLETAEEPTERLRLTRRGRKLAVSMVRRHRLLETFLHSALNVPVDQVHAEAERLEHAISDDIALRLARFLCYPPRDPHGHRIPYDDTDACSDGLPPLSSAPVGVRVRVVSLDDRDAETVRALAAARILPGLVAEVAATDGKMLQLRSGQRRIALRAALAAHVRIEPVRLRAPS
jgi:DtxR family Mn-dependent transcriptional regulator